MMSVTDQIDLHGARAVQGACLDLSLQEGMVITEAEEAVTDVLEIASLQLDHEPLRRP
jgi:hypothetical protein